MNIKNAEKNIVYHSHTPTIIQGQKCHLLIFYELKIRKQEVQVCFLCYNIAIWVKTETSMIVCNQIGRSLTMQLKVDIHISNHKKKARVGIWK